MKAVRRLIQLCSPEAVIVKGKKTKGREIFELVSIGAPIPKIVSIRNQGTGMTVARDLTIGGEEAQGDEQNQGQKKRGCWRAGILLSYEDDGRILTFDFGYVFVVIKLTNQNAILSCTEIAQSTEIWRKISRSCACSILLGYQTQLTSPAQWSQSLSSSWWKQLLTMEDHRLRVALTLYRLE